jgi:hypothetical protein
MSVYVCVCVWYVVGGMFTWCVYVVRGSVTSVCVYYVLVCVCTYVGTVVYDIYS